MSVTWYTGMTLDQLEREVILWNMRRWDGNKTKVSAVLGISIKTLYNKIEQYEKEGIAYEQSSKIEEERINDYNKRSGFKPGMYTYSENDADAERTRQADYRKRSGFDNGIGHDPDVAVAAEKARAEAIEQSRKKRVQNESRDGMESNSEIGSQRPMPVSERQEVQKVLPSQTTTRSARAAR